MKILFEPNGRPASSFSYRCFRVVLALQRYAGHRLAFRLGQLFTWRENRSRSKAEQIAQLVRMPNVYFQSGSSGTLVFEGGVYFEDDVKVNVTNSTIRLGDGCRLQKGTVLTASSASTMSIGSGTVFGPYCVIYSRAALHIGKNVMLGPKCSVMAETHGTEQSDVPYQLQPQRGTGIRIEDNVWLGAHVSVIDGITIGTGSIVSTGSTVLRNVPPYSLVAGVPGRVVRSLRAASQELDGTGSQQQSQAIH